MNWRPRLGNPDSNSNCRDRFTQHTSTGCKSCLFVKILTRQQILSSVPTDDRIMSGQQLAVVGRKSLLPFQTDEFWDTANSGTRLILGQFSLAQPLRLFKKFSPFSWPTFASKIWKDTANEVRTLVREIKDDARMLQKVPVVISTQNTVNSILMSVQRVKREIISGQQRTSLPSGAPAEQFNVSTMLAKR